MSLGPSQFHVLPQFITGRFLFHVLVLWYTISLEDSPFLGHSIDMKSYWFSLYRLQPSSWEKSIHCVCPGDYFISLVTDAGQFMVEMSIFFLWIIIRQFGDANTNRAIITLANIVREFKVLYILNICIWFMYIEYWYFIVCNNCHQCYVNHNFAWILNTID